MASGRYSLERLRTFWGNLQFFQADMARLGSKELSSLPLG